MSSADLFAYLAAFVTIVLAVALTDMIQSTHRLLRARERVKWDPLTPLLALSVILSLLSEFFGLWADAQFDRLTFYGLVGFMAVPMVVSLIAFAVLPDEVPDDGLDLRRFYFDNRRYIVILLMITAIGDIVRTIRWAMINNALGDADFWSLFAPVATINLVLLVIIYVSRSWWIQLAALCGSLILTHFSVGFWYISTTLGGSP